MKRTTMYIVLTLAAALALGLMAGCSSQPASTEQTQDEIIAELKDAFAKEPTFKSVTLTETSSATLAGDDADEANLAGTTVLKFDASGDKLKTYYTSTIDGITLEYYSVGDDAVCVTDGPVYSGKTEQFGMSHFAGAAEYLTDDIGNLDTIVDSVGTVTKEEQGDTTVYTLTMDTEKYIAADEILTTLAENDETKLTEAVITFGLDKDGRVVSTSKVTKSPISTGETTIIISDFDSTEIGAMPEATKTYEDMESDMNEKYDAFFNDVDGGTDAEKLEALAEKFEEKAADAK